MRRWILKAGATTLDGLVREDVARPEPGPHQVRIRVHAVSLNARDQMVLGGVYGRTPGRDLVPISDGAGEIDAVGAEVEGWAVGDRVASVYLRGWIDGPPKPDMGGGLGSYAEDGMLAEYVVLPAERVVRAPLTLDHAEAATLPCAALTAWNALQGAHPVGAGSKVLVLGSGGVSLFALVLARAVGADVTATSGQDAKRPRMLALGASDVVNSRENPEWGRAVFERTGGVDRVVNAVGMGVLNQALVAARYGGEVATIGFMDPGSGSPDGGAMSGKGLIVRGIGVGSVRMYDAMSQVIDAHRVRPPIDRRFGVDDVKDAYRYQSSPDLFGKVVVDLC